MLTLAIAEGAVLRLLEERDAPELYALIDDDRDHLARWLPWASGQTEQDTLEFIRATRRQLAADDGIQTAIEVDGAIAGMVGLRGVSWANGSTSIGYWLAARYEGRGLMTAAVRAHVEHAFGALGLRRVEIGAGVDNARSRAVIERLGFRLEGVRRDGERLDEGWHDIAEYALLAHERPPVGASTAGA